MNASMVSSLRTRNHSAYSAGTTSSVNAVATNRPPMMVMAMGPQKMLPASGIMPRMAARAVRTTGRARRTVAPMIARWRPWPAEISRSIWSTRITVLRMIMPASAISPSRATKPNGDAVPGGDGQRRQPLELEAFRGNRARNHVDVLDAFPILRNGVTREQRLQRLGNVLRREAECAGTVLVDLEPDRLHLLAPIK